LRGLAETLRVTLEAIRVFLEAMRVIIEAVRKIIEAVRLFVVVMAMISKRRLNKASILSSFSIWKQNESAYSRTCKDPSEANPAYSTP
jgi:hypothetical protein